MDATIVAPLDLSITEFAEAISLCFEDYVAPVRFLPGMLADMIRTESIDLTTSLYASDEDGPLGVALIARRDRRSRLAAMAVAKRARRQGLGKRLLNRVVDAARERGDTEMVLEVIEQNPPAVALYEANGFERVRRLVSYITELKGESDALLHDVPLSAVAGAARGLDLPWQICAATLEQLSSSFVGVEHEGIYAAMTEIGPSMVACRCLAWSGEPNLRDWLSAVANRWPGRKLMFSPWFPEEPYGAVLSGAGLQPGTFTQFEMRRSL